MKRLVIYQVAIESTCDRAGGFGMPPVAPDTIIVSRRPIGTLIVRHRYYNWTPQRQDRLVAAVRRVWPMLARSDGGA